MDFFMQVIGEMVPEDNVLRKINALIDWKRVGWKVGEPAQKPSLMQNARKLY